MALQRSALLSGGMSNTILYIPVYHYDSHLEFPSGCTAKPMSAAGGCEESRNATPNAHIRIDFKVTSMIRVTCRGDLHPRKSCFCVCVCFFFQLQEQLMVHPHPTHHSRFPSHDIKGKGPQVSEFRKTPVLVCTGPGPFAQTMAFGSPWGATLRHGGSAALLWHLPLTSVAPVRRIGRLLTDIIN